MKLYQIAEKIEELAPKDIAEEWDNVGVIVGDKNKEIHKVMVALDINSVILQQAIDNNVDLIVTHHPYIFKAINKIEDKILLKLIKNDIAVYSAHTNLDNCIDGVNKIFADILELKDVCREGMLAVGNCMPTTADEFIKDVKVKFKISGVRCTNVDMQKEIGKVAVLGGSGGDFVKEAAELNCDAYVTGEASYHDAQAAFENNILLITIGHFESENPVVDFICRYLSEKTDAEVFSAKPYNVYINV